MSSKVQITNKALQRVGAKSRVSVLDPPDGQNAIIVNSVWDSVEAEVFEAIKPKFASTRETLAQLASTPVFAWDYAYALPANFICFADDRKTDPVVSIGDVQTVANGGMLLSFLPFLYPWVIENIGDVLCFLSNYDSTTGGNDIYIRYIKSGVPTPLWNPSVVNAFATRLAAEIAFSITGDDKKELSLMQRYLVEKNTAIGENRKLDFVDDKGHDSYNDARAGVLSSYPYNWPLVR